MRALLPQPIERAWYVLTVLLRLGRPARPMELGNDPHLIESLCQIYGSPLFLTADGFITVSGSALSCFLRYWSDSTVSSPWSTDARVCENGRSQVGVVYSRKRKARGYECMMPTSTKRRLLIGCERGKISFLLAMFSFRMRFLVLQNFKCSYKIKVFSIICSMHNRCGIGE